jgi:hypothetical protein
MKCKITLGFLLIVAVLSGCYKKYNRSIGLCDDKLFIEKYDNSLIDIGYHYLTDSCTFRIYVGRYDNEHGSISYKCKTDSIIIFHDFDGTSIIKTAFSLAQLKKRHDFHFWNSKCSSCK